MTKLEQINIIKNLSKYVSKGLAEGIYSKTACGDQYPNELINASKELVKTILKG